MSGGLREVDPRLVRPALEGLVPYQPGKPVEEVQRELGLERVVKLASNEGPFGPFPAAREALERNASELNRYPDGGSFRLSVALAERHGVRPDEIAVCAGADAVIGYLSLALLDPGDEVVTGWPSFPSYVIDARKVGAVPRLVPLVGDRFDLDGLLDAITPRTKLVYVALPNNPTGTSTTRAELARFLERVPEHVLTVLDQAYFEYVDDPDHPDAIEEVAKQGHRVVVLRTFSKMFGLAGLRVGYGVGPASVMTAVAKVRRPFDVSSAAQEAALASLPDTAEVARRRDVNRTAMALLDRVLRDHGLQPAGPALGNFVFARVGGDGGAFAQALERRGVIVRPMGGFGAPDAIRVTAGTPDEIAFLAEQLAALSATAA